MSEGSEHETYRNALSLALDSRCVEAAAKLLEMRRVETAFAELRGRLAEIAEQQSGLHLELRADIRELRNLIGELRTR